MIQIQPQLSIFAVRSSQYYRQHFPVAISSCSENRENLSDRSNKLFQGTKEQKLPQNPFSDLRLVQQFWRSCGTKITEQLINQNCTNSGKSWIEIPKCIWHQIKIVLGNQGAKTVLESALRSPVPAIALEELADKKVRMIGHKLSSKSWICDQQMPSHETV